MTFDELLDSLLGPTGIPDRLRAVNSIFNPVEGVRDSMQASRTLFAPETSPMGRVEATGNALAPDQNRHPYD